MKFFATLALIANVSAIHLVSQANVKSKGDFTASISEKDLMAVMGKVDDLTQKIDALLKSPAIEEALGPLEAGVMEAGGKLMANPDVMGEVTGIEQGV